MKGQTRREVRKESAHRHGLQQVPPQILFLNYMAIMSEIVSLDINHIEQGQLFKKAF